MMETELEKGMDPMNQNKHGSHGNEGPARDRVRHDHRPYWRDAHHDWRFWVGLFLMFAAITIYAMRDNLRFLSHG
jgi:hypothetical protein